MNTDTNQEPIQDQGVIYGLDDKPPVGRALILAIQHVLTMFGATVAVPLMLGPEGDDGSGMGMDRALSLIHI